MEAAIRLQTMVLPGGRIEIESSDLLPGARVEVIIVAVAPQARRSALDILAEAPGQRLFKNHEEVDAYIREERATWDR